MKISILTHDFSQNNFGRAWLLAKLLQPRYDIEIVGPKFGQGIWEPLAELCDFTTKTVTGYPNGRFEFRKMMDLISGDVIYAVKPLLASFGAGLMKRVRTLKPLVLDIDDWEIGFEKEVYDSLRVYQRIRKFRAYRSNWRSYLYTVLFNKLVRLADAITVSGIQLQKMYGGSVIWHGRDTDLFDPACFEKNNIRKNSPYRFSEDDFVVGFIGTPRPHKGMEDLIDAVALLKNRRIVLMIAGMDSGAYCSRLRQKASRSIPNDRLLFLPEQPFDRLPELLTAIDLVVVPQRNRSASRGQVPAKIFDAMAMAKPIVATNVSDILHILKGCGWVIEPENIRKLAKTVQYVYNHPIEARQMGLEARKKCNQEYSWKVLGKKLAILFARFESIKTRGGIGRASGFSLI